eukprot:3189231-Amphidinium_carterae.1
MSQVRIHESLRSENPWKLASVQDFQSCDQSLQVPGFPHFESSLTHTGEERHDQERSKEHSFKHL